MQQEVMAQGKGISLAPSLTLSLLVPVPACVRTCVRLLSFSLSPPVAAARSLSLLNRGQSLLALSKGRFKLLRDGEYKVREPCASASAAVPTSHSCHAMFCHNWSTCGRICTVAGVQDQKCIGILICAYSCILAY